MEIYISLSKSDVLYHVCSAQTAIHILKSNALHLQAFNARHTEMKFGKGFYLSTARHRLGGYAMYTKMPVSFNLDGRKLGQRYKFVPIDFINGDADHSQLTDDDRTQNEAEDRLVSNKPVIPQANKYTSSIDLLVDAETSPYLRSIASLCRKLRIKLNLYTTYKKYQIGHKKDRIPLAAALEISNEHTVQRTKERLGPSRRRARRISPLVNGIRLRRMEALVIAGEVIELISRAGKFQPSPDNDLFKLIGTSYNEARRQTDKMFNIINEVGGGQIQQPTPLDAKIREAYNKIHSYLVRNNTPPEGLISLLRSDWGLEKPKRRAS